MRIIHAENKYIQYHVNATELSFSTFSQQLYLNILYQITLNGFVYLNCKHHY